MTEFYIYTDDGKILMTGQCPSADLPLQKVEGATTKTGIAVLGKHQVTSDGELKELPPKPTEHHVFNYTSKQWDDPRTPATEWPLVRITRDTLLSDTDWVVTKAVETGIASSTPWKVYRQALRDITTQADPFNLVWPVLPL